MPVWTTPAQRHTEMAFQKAPKGVATIPENPPLLVRASATPRFDGYSEPGMDAVRRTLTKREGGLPCLSPESLASRPSPVRGISRVKGNCKEEYRNAS